jgi:hypothetical protein
MATPSRIFTGLETAPQGDGDEQWQAVSEHHRSRQLIDEEKHVNHHRRSTQRARKGLRWSHQSRQVPPQFPEQDLQLPPTLGKLEEVRYQAPLARAHLSAAHKGPSHPHAVATLQEWDATTAPG